MITGSLRIELISGSNRLSQLRSALRLPPNTKIPELTYELIRNVAWASTGGRIPVPRRTLLDRAMAFDIEESQNGTRPIDRRRSLSEKLDELTRLGEVAVLKHGNCMSAPGAVIELPGKNQAGLLVSGMPLCRLPDATHAEVLLRGPIRTVAGLDVAQEIGLPRIGVDDWIGRSGLGLAALTDAYLSIPTSDGCAPIATDTAEVYHPLRVRPGSRHSERWVPLERDLNGRHLVRFTGVDGTASHHIAEFVRGEILGMSDELVHDVPRLLHGLDARYRRPTLAYWSTNQDGVRLRTSEHLPSTETRALIALTGSPPTGRTWNPSVPLEDVRRTLSDLNIRFITNTAGR
jgi:hypothetical protein